MNKTQSPTEKLRFLNELTDKGTMKNSKFIFLTLLLTLITSCSHQSTWNETSNITENFERMPASENDCKTLASNIINNDKQAKALLTEEKPQSTAIQNLQAKGLLKFKDRFLILNYPGRDWINSVRKNFISHLKKWNKNRYPIFYMTDEKNYQKIGAQLPELLEKKLANSLSDEESKIFDTAMAQLDSFMNYQKDIDSLIEERISLQYNIEVLKKLILDDKPIDIKISIKKADGISEEIVTIRKEDKNRSLVIDKLKKQVREIDGRLFKYGKIEERVVQQAFLKDILTIFHREVEYAHKNGLHASEDLAKLYEKLDQALVNSDFTPSSYGVYRVDRQVLQTELMMFTNMDKGVVKLRAGKERLRAGFRSFFSDPNAGTDDQKVGFFTSIYNSISTMTVADVTKYGVAVAVGVGASQYFMVDKTATEVNANSNGSGSDVKEVTPVDPSIVVPEPNNEVGVSHSQLVSTQANNHSEQLANTKKVEESYIASKYHLIQSKVTGLFN